MGVFGDKVTNQQVLNETPGLETALRAGGTVHRTPRGLTDGLMPSLPRLPEMLVNIGSGPRGYLSSSI